VSLCNATGNAEHVSLSAEYGTESSSQFALAYEQPRIGGLPATVGGVVSLPAVSLCAWGLARGVQLHEPGCAR
jgi:hypothetical protein